jgi:predicted SAM-dependent methyltransferase
MPTGQVVSRRRFSTIWNVLARIGITLAAFGFLCLLRPDIATWSWRNTGVLAANTTHRLRSPSIIARYLKDNSVRKLQLGAGEFNLPGWLNTDIEPIEGQAFLDASQHFPLPDSSFQLIFSEQVVEHLSYEQGLIMMKESFRVLEHGGKVRVATPNLLKLADLLREDKTPQQEAYIRAKTDWHDWRVTADPASFIVNSEMTEFGHRFVYTPRMLRTAMESAGFTNVRQYESGESNDAALRGLEVRSHSSVRDIDRYETMVFEGVRP